MAEILVVDDEAPLRRMVIRALKEAGHNTHEASGGTQALALLQQVPVGLVITDIVMAEGEGIETIRQMRQQAPELPIIAISGGSHQDLYLRAATALGATTALEKPFEVDDLLALVERLLGRNG